jgi:hypothetical protein
MMKVIRCVFVVMMRFADGIQDLEYTIKAFRLEQENDEKVLEGLSSLSRV